MNKPVHKYTKKSKHAKPQEQLVEKVLKELIGVCNEYTRTLVNRVFLIMKRSMTYNIMNIGEQSRFANYDVKMFECYEATIKSYKEAIDYYDANHNLIANKKVKNITQGIYSLVLSSVGSESAAEKKVENPVAAEKKNIINRYVAAYINQHDQTAQAYAGKIFSVVAPRFSPLLACDFDVSSSLRIIDETVNEIEKNYSYGIFGYIEQLSKQCVAELNDIEKRPVASQYLDLLEKEMDILSSIAKIQIRAIEVTMRLDGVRYAEKITIDGFLSKINGAYESLKDFTANMEGGKQREREDYKKFCEKLRDSLIAKDIIPMVAFEESRAARNELFAKAESAAKAAIGRRLHKKVKFTAVEYELHKILAENVSMTNDMINAFKKCAGWINEHKDLVSKSAQLEICDGIKETILIKIESLSENLSAFINEAEAELAVGKAESKGDNAGANEDEAIKASFEAFIAAVFLNELNTKEVAAALDNCISNEPTEQLYEENKKISDSKKQRILKKVSSFKKDILLYEMSTFEEIINYSVSRLRESEEEADILFVKSIDETTKKLFEVLTKNNINVIMPEAHTVFNGALHEVLIAEKNEGFAKGEIIKVLNAGYKQGDVVIMRANVVAAK